MITSVTFSSLTHSVKCSLSQFSIEFDQNSNLHWLWNVIYHFQNITIWHYTSFVAEDKNVENEKAVIYYHDIGDYLSREDKLLAIKNYATVLNNKIIWNTLIPNEHGDWISHRNAAFDNFIQIEAEKKLAYKSDMLSIIGNCT